MPEYKYVEVSCYTASRRCMCMSRLAGGARAWVRVWVRAHTKMSTPLKFFMALVYLICNSQQIVFVAECCNTRKFLLIEDFSCWVVGAASNC